MGATLATAVPGWDYEVADFFAARVADGHAREVARVRGHAFVLALAISEFGPDGLTETVELLQPAPDLQEGAVRAEAEARVRAEHLRTERSWIELSVGAARALAPFNEAPFLAVRKIGDGSGITSMYVRVAVLALDPVATLGIDFVRAVGMDSELASWFASRGA